MVTDTMRLHRIFQEQQKVFSQHILRRKINIKNAKEIYMEKNTPKFVTKYQYDCYDRKYVE